MLLYHTREVWWVHLGLNVGFEQDGMGEYYKRPVLILRGLSRNVCIIIPLTTSEKRNMFYVDAGVVAGKSAAAIISQIRLIDTKRLVEKIATMPVKEFEVIRKSVRDLL